MTQRQSTLSLLALFLTGVEAFTTCPLWSRRTASINAAREGDDYVAVMVRRPWTLV
jgi:hypothetical protein